MCRINECFEFFLVDLVCLLHLIYSYLLTVFLLLLYALCGNKLKNLPFFSQRFECSLYIKLAKVLQFSLPTLTVQGEIIYELLFQPVQWYVSLPVSIRRRFYVVTTLFGRQQHCFNRYVRWYVSMFWKGFLNHNFLFDILTPKCLLEIPHSIIEGSPKKNSLRKFQMKEILKNSQDTPYYF